MAFQANPPGFGLNHFDENDWARWNAIRGPRFRVADAAALQPSVNTGVARTITLAAGRADCCGVPADNVAPVDVQFAANGGGSDRFDFLVVRWDWATGSVDPAIIQGSSAAPTINLTQSVNSAQVNRIPGVQYDALVAMVRIGPAAAVFAPSDLSADLRVWGGAPLVTRATGNHSLIDVPFGGMLQSPSGTSQQVMVKLESGAFLTLNPPTIAPIAASGRVDAQTTKIIPDQAITGVITVPSVSQAHRVVFTAAGRTGFATGARRIRWDWDSFPARATNIVKDDQSTAVNVAAGQFAAVTSSVSMDLPAGVAATARLVYRSGDGDGYNRGAVVWHRSPIV